MTISPQHMQNETRLVFAQLEHHLIPDSCSTCSLHPPLVNCSHHHHTELVPELSHSPSPPTTSSSSPHHIQHPSHLCAIAANHRLHCFSMATTHPFTLSTSLPLPTSKQPRSAVAYDDTNIVVGFVDGSIASFDQDSDSKPPTYTLREESTHKIADGMLLGLSIVPDGHELLTETSLITCSADKSIKNVLNDGTEIFAISPLTDIFDSHSASVENALFAPDEKKTLVTAGWDGKIKFWQSNECMLSIQLRNEYSTQILAVNGNQLLMASASKTISMVSVNYEKLYAEFASKQQRILEMQSQSSNNAMSDFVSLGDTRSDAPTQQTAALTQDEAITADVITILHHKPQAHYQVIRRIIPLYTSMSASAKRETDLFATISNDGTLKVWKINEDANAFDLISGVEIIRSVGDQSEFLYDLVQIPHYLSDFQANSVSGMSMCDADISSPSTIIVAIACDDSTVRFIDISAVIQNEAPTAEAKRVNEKLFTSPKIKDSYHSPFELQCIEFPAVPRFLTMLPSSDFITITPAGAFLLTNQEQRFGTDQLHLAFNESISSAAEKAKKMTNINLEQLASVETLFSPAEKDGAHKIVNIGGKPMVVQWSSPRFEWVLIGEAMGSDNSEGQGNKKFYNGQYWDHTVDVDTGGNTRLTLAFNSDEDPYKVADRFLEANQLGQEAMLQVVQFIMPYIDQKKLQQRKEREAFEAANKLSYISTTNWPYLTRSGINMNLIMKAVNNRVTTFINEGNQATFLWPTANVDSSLDKPLQRLYATVANATVIDSTVNVCKGDIEILTTMLSKWPISQLTPIFDILRVISSSPLAHALLFNPSEATVPVSSNMKNYVQFLQNPTNLATLAATTPSTPFQQQFYELLHIKCFEAIQNSIVPNNNASFATLSLIFDLFSNIIGKRPNVRAEKAFADVLTYIELLYDMIIGIKSADGGMTVSSYVINAANTNGPKLIPQLITLVFNICSFCNRIPKSQFGAMFPRIGVVLCTYLTFLIELSQNAIKANVDGTVVDDASGVIIHDKITPLLIDYATMVCYECDSFEEVKLLCRKETYTSFWTTLSKSLTALVRSGKSTAQEANNARDLVKDLKTLFGV